MASLVANAVRASFVKYRRLYDAAPYVMAFTTCFIKGIGSDTLAQTTEHKVHIEQDQRRRVAFMTREGEHMEEAEEENEQKGVETSVWSNWNWSRTAGLALFSGIYTGGVQHFVYNVLFRRLFGSGRHAVGFALARTVLLKTAVDMGIHVPFFYIPAYYVVTNMIEGKTAMQGLRHYMGEARQTLMAAWAVWTPVQLVTFALVPPQFRVAWISFVSIMWLALLSHLSHHKAELEEGVEHNDPVADAAVAVREHAKDLAVEQVVTRPARCLATTPAVDKR